MKNVGNGENGLIRSEKEETDDHVIQNSLFSSFKLKRADQVRVG